VLNFYNKLNNFKGVIKEKNFRFWLSGSAKSNKNIGNLNKDIPLKIAADPLQSVYFVDLDNIIDLTNPKANSFSYKNISEISRFYYKLEFNDIDFLIKNINDFSSLKDFFLKKNLDKFPVETVSDANRESTLTYIPENKKGLYFCHQKVRVKNNQYLNFFQIFNFINKKIIGFDTEDSVLIYSLLDDADSKKYYIYSENAELLDAKEADNRGIIKIRNINYRNLYIARRSPNLVLYRLILNGIKRSGYKINAYYNDNDAQNLKIFGTLKNIYGDKAKSNYELRIITLDNITLFSRKIEQISSRGSFELDIRKDFLPKNDLIMSFYSNNIKIKDYKFNIFTDNYYNELKNDNENIKLIEDAVFNSNPLIFGVHNAIADNIDFISYSISASGRNEIKGTTKKIINNKFELNLPEQSSLYKIGLEVILKDGSLIKKYYTVNKYLINSDSGNILKNERIIVENDDFSTNTINFVNPFNNASGLCVIFNNNIETYFKIDLKNGINTLILDNKYYSKPDLKTLIIINDSDNHNTIYTVKKSYYMNHVMQTLNGKYSDRVSGIRVDTLLNLNLFNKKNEIYCQKFNNAMNYSEYLFKIFYNYNDFLSPEESTDFLYKGEKIPVDNKYKNYFLAEVNENQDYTMGYYIQDDDSRIYYNFKKIIRKKIIQTAYHGPENFSYENKPDFRLNIKNITDKNLNLDAVISSNNGIINAPDSSIQLKPFEAGHIKFKIEKYRFDLPIDLRFHILNDDKNIYSFNKRLNDNVYFSERVVEISGSIIENRETSSYFVIPESASNDFNIELYLSTNNFISLYKNNPSFNEFKLDYFELGLSAFLNYLIEKRYYPNTDFNIDSLFKFYLKDKGFKRFISDKDINLEATFLLLLSYKYINNKDFNIPVNAIIKNLIKNYYPRILNSDFHIFVLAEYGFFLDEITADYLSVLKEKKRVLFYYKYLNKFNLRLRNITDFNEYYSADYNFSESFFELLKLYHGFENINFKKIDSYSNLIDNILSKIILIKQNSNIINIKEKLNISFKSSKLDNFNYSLNKNEIIYKKYYFRSSVPDEKQSNIIDYSIGKQGNHPLYYLLRTYYKSSDSFGINKNNKREVNTEWIDENGNILDKNNLKLINGKKYKINCHIYLDINENELFFRPINSESLLIDFKSILINDANSKLYLHDDNTIILKKLKKGLNTLSFVLKPYYTGEYEINGVYLFDLFNFKKLIFEDKITILIED